MPFQSESQRKWMYANHPEMAVRWEKETPKGKLPKRVEKHAAFVNGFLDEIIKLAKEKREGKSFLKQDRPAKTKEIYRAMTRRKKEEGDLRKRYGKRWKEVAARVAGRQGKPGKQKQGPPYKESI